MADNLGGGTGMGMSGAERIIPRVLPAEDSQLINEEGCDGVGETFVAPFTQA